MTNEGGAPSAGSTPSPNATPAPASSGAPSTPAPKPDSGAPAAGAPASGPSSGAWYAGFSDPALAAHPSLRKFQDPESLARSYVELEKKLGTTLTRPGPNATRADWEAFWNKIGRPERVEDYKLEKPKLPEGVQWDPSVMEGFDAFAHQIGLTRWQAQQLVHFYGGKISAQLTKGRGGMSPEKAEKVLRQTWGAAYEHNMELAKRAVAHLGGEPLVKALRETGLGSHPELVKFAAAVGAFLAEDNVIRGDTPAQTSAKAEYDALMNDPKSAYWDRNHPNHKRAVERVQQLAALVYPGKTPA